MTCASMEQSRAALMSRIGLQPFYLNNNKQPCHAQETSIDAVLAAFDYSFGTADEAADCVQRFDRAHWARVLDPVYAVWAGADGLAQPMLEIRVSNRASGISWHLKGESLELRGEAALAELSVAPGEGFDGFSSRLLPLPEVHTGYFQLSVTVWGPAGAKVPESGGLSRLIVAPQHCYLPPSILQGQRLFGISTLLSGARSTSNWGRGNLGDAKQMTRALAGYGVQFIGFGPMSAIEPDGQGMQSPFNANSRVMSNLRILDLSEAIARLGLSDCSAALSDADFLAKLEQAKAGGIVPNETVDPLLLHWLETMWEEFKLRHLAADTEPGAAFRSICDAQGSVAVQYATYATLRERYMRIDPMQGWNWKNWPAEYHSPASQTVQAFQSSAEDRIRFYVFIEWLVHSDLLDLRRVAEDAGMSIGPYMNLALASSPGGFDTWANQGLYLPGVHLGVPGDAFEPNGQDWGNPVTNHLELLARRALPLSRMISYWMEMAGGLEVDHGPSISRIYAIPDGLPPNDGVYITQPREVILAILALESHRHRSVVIAETLGTVSEDLPKQLCDKRVLSYCVHRWERDGKRLKTPSELPQWSCLIPSNFNIENIMVVWLGWYLLFRRIRGLNNDQAAADKMNSNRAEERQMLADAYVREGLLAPEMVSKLFALVPAFADGVDDSTLASLSDVRLPDELLTAVIRYVARAPSVLTAFDLRELMGVLPMANVPGTDQDKWENWRQRDPFDVADLRDNSRLRELFAAIAEERAR